MLKWMFCITLAGWLSLMPPSLSRSGDDFLAQAPRRDQATLTQAEEADLSALIPYTLNWILVWTPKPLVEIRPGRLSRVDLRRLYADAARHEIQFDVLVFDHFVIAEIDSIYTSLVFRRCGDHGLGPPVIHFISRERASGVVNGSIDRSQDTRSIGSGDEARAIVSEHGFPFPTEEDGVIREESRRSMRVDFVSTSPHSGAAPYEDYNQVVRKLLIARIEELVRHTECSPRSNLVVRIPTFNASDPAIYVAIRPPDKKEEYVVQYRIERSADGTFDIYYVDMFISREEIGDLLERIRTVKWWAAQYACAGDRIDVSTALAP